MFRCLMSDISLFETLLIQIDEYACRDPFLDPDYSPALAAQAPPKNVIATPMKIGFLGLGIMGTGMVNNLLISGHEVTVWNRTPSKVSSLHNIECALGFLSPTGQKPKGT